MSSSTLSKTELKSLCQIIAALVKKMTGGELSEGLACRLWLNPPSIRNGWLFTVNPCLGPAETLGTWAAPTTNRAVLLCDLRERQAEPGLLNRKVAEAKANLKAAGLLPK